jgi:hypothetical protein
MFREGISPEVLFGAGVLVLAIVIAYAVVRAGRLTRSERARSDAGARLVQDEEEARHRAGED